VPEAFAARGRRLGDLGLERTAVCVRSPDEDPISPDPAVRRMALATTKRAIECCEAAGCALLGGPSYAALGRFSGSPPAPEARAHSLALMSEAADCAARSCITLGLEFLNRFEIYLLHTAADTARFCADAGRPNLGVHCDTFHAQIEEKSVRAAIEVAAPALARCTFRSATAAPPVAVKCAGT
jgi:D-psicose/D-tagatose/L-ribulose 3-epimerase